MSNDELNAANPADNGGPDNSGKSSGCLGGTFKFCGIIFLCYLAWLAVTSWPLLMFWIFAPILAVTVLVKFKKRVVLLIFCLCALIFLGVAAYDYHDYLEKESVAGNEEEKAAPASLSCTAEKSAVKTSPPEPVKQVSESDLVAQAEDINKKLQQQQPQSDMIQKISQNTIDTLLKNISVDSSTVNLSNKQVAAGETDLSDNAAFIQEQQAKAESEKRFDEEVLYTEKVLSDLTNNR